MDEYNHRKELQAVEDMEKLETALKLNDHMTEGVLLLQKGQTSEKE